MGLGPFDQFRHLLILENLEGRTVGAAGEHVAPDPELPKIGQSAVSQPARPFDSPGLLGIAFTIAPGGLHHRAATLPVPLHPSPLAQLAVQALGELLQIARVVDRVAQLRLG